MRPPQPLYLQKKVLEKLGLSQSELTHIRQMSSLAKTTDWIVNGRDVALTRSGLAAVLQHLSATSRNKYPELEEFADCVVPAPGERLRAWRFNFTFLTFSFGAGDDDSNPRPKAR